MLHWYRPPLTLDRTRGEEKIYEAWNSFVCVSVGLFFCRCPSFETSVVSPRHSAVALYRIIIDAQHIWLGSQQQQRQLSLVPTYLECMYCIYLHFASASTYIHLQRSGVSYNIYEFWMLLLQTPVTIGMHTAFLWQHTKGCTQLLHRYPSVIWNRNNHKTRETVHDDRPHDAATFAA